MSLPPTQPRPRARPGVRAPAASRRAALCAALAAAAIPSRAQESAVLSPAQREWLARRTDIRFGPERNYGPFVYAEADGRLSGLSVEMLDLVARHTGLKVRALPAGPLHDWLEAVRRGRVDLLSSLRPTPERAAFLVFTRPYVSVPAVVMVSAARPPGRSLADFDGRRVAVGRGYAVESVMRRRYPAVDWQAVSDDLEGLRGLAEGRFEAAVADVASASYIARTHQLGGLQSGGPVDFEYALCFAVRKDWPELRDIIDAGIAAITPAERVAVLARWVPDLSATALPGDPLERTPRATWIGVGLIAVAAGAAVLAWSRRRGAAVGTAPAAEPGPAAGTGLPPGGT